MTPDDLRTWQTSMGHTYDSAAAALGVNRSTYATWISGRRPISLAVSLACAALSQGLREWQPGDIPAK